MGSNTVTAIYIALLLSPAISILALIPYIIFHYKKYKIIYADRSMCFYLLCLFFLSAYFMTMLPFPSIESVAKLNTPTMQMAPFMVVHDYFEDSGVSVSDITSVIPSLTSGAFTGPILNIIMLIPFGFFLRLTFETTLAQTTIAGLLASLLFEVTQLTALFGIYPRPYRMFDIDDLITNTIGAMMGWLLVALLKRIYPKSVEIGKKPMRQGGGISLRRRMPAIIFNQGISLVITLVVGCFLQYGWKKRIPACALLFLILDIGMGAMLYLHNNSLGFRLTGLELVNDEDGEPPAMWQCILYMILQGFTLILPVTMGYLVYYSMTIHRMRRVIIIAFSVALTIMYIYIIFAYLINGITHGTRIYSDKICRTRLTLSDKARQTHRFVVLEKDTLNYDTADLFCDSAYSFLMDNEFDEESARKARILTDEVMHEWLEYGLGGETCELRFDDRRWRRTLFLILYTTKQIDISERVADEEFGEFTSGMRLSFESYYDDGAYIVAIDIP